MQIIGKSTQRDIKHNNTPPHKGMAVRRCKIKAGKDKDRPKTIGLTVPAPTNGLNFNVAVLGATVAFMY